VLDRIKIPCREIYDLVVAPKKMLEGLRNGFRTNRLRAAERDQYAMFEQVGVQPTRLWAVGDPLAPEDCRVRIDAELPSHVVPDSLIEQECTIENLGGAILVSAPPNPIHLSYKWIDPDSGLKLEGTEGLRSKLPHSLPPQRSAICKMKIRTPAVEGRFLLRVTLVQEEIAWFDDLSTDNGCEATVSIEAPAVGTDKIQTN
jgi:acetolactate synthase-1/2/3 large subunit